MIDFNLTSIRIIPKVSLEKWRTGTLGANYVAASLLVPRFPKARFQRDMISDVMSQRPIEETARVREEIKGRMDYYVKIENYEEAARYRDILQHFDVRITNNI